ncbi:MAG TPA: hypothetical protein VHF26_24835, partial [Trebonia sp.]|nr:hypothetical protein [Trebonia sp.]
SQSLRSLARARAARAPQQQPGPGSYTGPQPVPGTGSYTGPQAFSGAPSGGPADPGTGPMELADWYPQARGDQSGYPQPAPPLAPEAEQPPAGSSVPYWNVAGNGAGDAPGQPGSSWYTAGYQPEQDTSGAYAAGTSAYPAYSPPGYAASPQSPAASGSGAYPQPGYAAYAPPAAYGADAYNASYNASAPGAADVRPSPAPGPAANGTGGYPAQPGYPVPPSYPPAYPADGAPYQGQPGGYPGQTAGSGAFPAPGGGAPWGGDANGYQTGNGYAYPNGQGHVNGYAASGHEGYSAGQPAGPLGEGTSAQPQAEGQQGYWEHGQQSPGNWS